MQAPFDHFTRENLAKIQIDTMTEVFAFSFFLL